MAEATTKVGRPLKFKSAKELQKKIEEYFESCHEEIWREKFDPESGESMGWVPILDRHGEIQKRLVKPYTISGLAVFLETSRQTLLEYEEKQEFIDTIKRAKDRIENYAEESLYTSKQTAGVIFNLVNNHGWQNKQENKVDVNAKVDVSQKPDLSNLTDEELSQLEELLRKSSESR